MSLQLHIDLARWLRDRLDDGTSREMVMASMLNTGYDAKTIEEACALAFDTPDKLDAIIAKHAKNAENAKPPATWAEEFTPAHPIPLAEARNRVSSDHGDIQVVARSGRPYVLALANFLTADECSELIEYARGRISRATVVNSVDGGDLVDERRTSELVMLRLAETPLIDRIDKRIEALTGIPVPHGEGLQVMRYGVGAEYQAHYDYFDFASPGEAMHLKFGQRVATLVMYLNNVEGGGQTTFPNGDIEVVPQTGNAVYFAYTDREGRSDTMSFHGGAPVTAGEKWIATKWMRERPYHS